MLPSGAVTPAPMHWEFLNAQISLSALGLPNQPTSLCWSVVSPSLVKDSETALRDITCLLTALLLLLSTKPVAQSSQGSDGDGSSTTGRIHNPKELQKLDNRSQRNLFRTECWDCWIKGIEIKSWMWKTLWISQHCVMARMLYLGNDPTCIALDYSGSKYQTHAKYGRIRDKI